MQTYFVVFHRLRIALMPARVAILYLLATVLHKLGLNNGAFMTLCNPWKNLPEKSFVLIDDIPYVEVFNKTSTYDTKILTNLLPEPFFGRFDAPVLILLQNPGFDESDIEFHKKPEFQQKLLAAIQAEKKFPPHFHLQSEAKWPGGEWWRENTKSLIKDFGQLCVANNILAIQYFPYHSKKFDHASLRLPSQEFSFWLVRDAIKRNAIILCMRNGHKKWFGAVPQLASYKHFILSKNRSPSISANNLGPSSYKLIVDILSKTLIQKS
jgi:hypothetical protein